MSSMAVVIRYTISDYQWVSPQSIQATVASNYQAAVFGFGPITGVSMGTDPLMTKIVVSRETPPLGPQLTVQVIMTGFIVNDGYTDLDAIKTAFTGRASVGAVPATLTGFSATINPANIFCDGVSLELWGTSASFAA